MDWTKFFNPSSWGSFAPSFMSPAADQMAQGSGAPTGIGKGAPVSPVGATSGGGINQNAFNMGMKMLQGDPIKAQPMQIHFAQPVGYHPTGMLG